MLEGTNTNLDACMHCKVLCGGTALPSRWAAGHCLSVLRLHSLQKVSGDVIASRKRPGKELEEVTVARAEGKTETNRVLVLCLQIPGLSHF